MPLTYKINILQALKDRGYTTTKLRRENLLAQGVIQSLREKKPISWANIEKICALLHCQPGDMIEFVFAPEEGGQIQPSK